LRRWLPGLGLLLGIAQPGLALSIDPALSSIAAGSGAVESLVGSLGIALGRVPVTATTTLDVTSLVATSSGGLAVSLDPASPSPGAGVVNPAGSFLVPTLFLRVQDALGSFDLAVSDVTGSVVFDATGTAVERLSTTFQIDSGGPAGLLTVTVVAALPEPGGLAPGAAGLALALALRRRGARACGRRGARACGRRGARTCGRRGAR
jgi:hypothetical protein